MKKLSNYKKTVFWIITVALVACIVVGIVLLSGTKNDGEDATGGDQTAENPASDNSEGVVSIPYTATSGAENTQIFTDHEADPGKIIGLEKNELQKKYGYPTGSFCDVFGDFYENEKGEWLCIYYNSEDGKVETVQKGKAIIKAKELGGYVYKCSESPLEIRLNGDSSYVYSSAKPEAGINHTGNWYNMDSYMLITTENMQRNFFDIVDDTLIYRKGDSNGFDGYDIPDRAVFKKVESILDGGHAYDQVVRYDDLDNNNYLMAWMIARSPYEIMLSSYHNLTDGSDARISLALYLNNEFIIDLPKVGYAKVGTFIIDQEGLVLTSKDGSLKLVFDIDEEAEPNKIVPQSTKIRFNAEKSTPQCSEIGLYNGMELEYSEASSTVTIDGYSEVVIPWFEETDKGLDIYGRYYVTRLPHDGTYMNTISRYVDGKLANRLSFMNMSISDLSLHEESINGEKHLFLSATYSNSVYAGKTFNYEIFMKNGHMVLAKTDENSAPQFAEKMIDKWNVASVLMGMKQ
ncbi:MAG: hypothetical protein IK007_03530 [Lachnospiraceae bacterium]|nr:hypothetical protein [Lachnospiraceae bacterium]